MKRKGSVTEELPPAPGPSDLERIAYHEAGHAVAFCLLRVPLREASILPNADSGSLGHCEFGRFAVAAFPSERRRNYDRRRAEARMAICLAGTIAERMSVGDEKRRGLVAPADYHAAAELATTYAAYESKDLEAYLGRIYSETRVLLTLPLHWRAVEALAAVLLERKRLSGREVRRIVVNIVGRQPRWRLHLERDA